MESKVIYGSDKPEDIAIFDIPTGKYNERIILTEADKKNRVRVLCKEPYAQEQYNRLSKFIGDFKVMPKDLMVGEPYQVIIKSFSPETMLYTTEEVNSKTQIYVAVNECIPSFDEIKENPRIGIIITREHSGMFFGSNIAYNSIIYKNELDIAYKNDTAFDVRIVELIKGGYKALYKESVECFLPGGQAAANIIKDFNTYINKTVTVMIDNYDNVSNFYIVSFKKYVKHAMPTKIKELKFGTKYTGHLTDKPTKFGLFVEFGNGFFTGLIHKTEFNDYSAIEQHFGAGDSIDFYIKDTINKNGSYRVILTMDEDNINPDMLEWQDLKNEVEGEIINFRMNDNKDFFITLPSSGVEVKIRIPFKAIRRKVYKYNNIKVNEVDVINKILNFDFC